MSDEVWTRDEIESPCVKICLIHPEAERILRERVLAMKEIWTEEEAEFHGEYVDFEKLWSYPKPVSPGGPPVLMGASSKWSPQCPKAGPPWPRCRTLEARWSSLTSRDSRAASSSSV